jgi:hypothetical protein
LNIYFFTKTIWVEPPRMRHQLARLLIANGHKVFFFQKPVPLYRKKLEIDSLNEVILLQHNELLHHQLRPIKLLQLINGAYCEHQIIKLTYKISPPDLIINFNYDYYFLRNIFPTVPLITLLNDDFVSMAKLWMKREANRVINHTLAYSDHILTVSSYTKEDLYPGENISLFLPWCEHVYKKPIHTKERNTVLYYGHINFDRINWSIFKNIVEKTNYNYRIVGPIEKTPNNLFKQLINNNRVELVGPEDINELDTSNVFCSLVTYNINHPAMYDLTMNNRIMRLLPKGIPTVISKMPYFIPVSKDVIWKADSVIDFIGGINYFHENFMSAQQSIEKFVSKNSASNRYVEFNKLVEKLNQRKYI